MIRPIRPTISRRAGLTSSERELIPYTQQAEQDIRGERRRIQPLKWIFDILQRGQYMTANVAKEITQSARSGESLGQAAADALKGALRGIRGKEKGDWESVLFGGTDPGAEEFQGWVKDSPGLNQPLIRPKFLKPTAEGETRGFLRPRKMLGLAANILLDPTTYISFGGTAAAKGATVKYVDDVAKLALMSRGRTAVDTVGDLVGKTGAQMKKVLGSKTDEVTRAMANLVKQTKREAKHLTQPQMVQNIQDLLKKLNLPEQASRQLALVDDVGAKVASEAAEEPWRRGLNELMEGLDTKYQGAGESGLRVFGNEYFKGNRPRRLWQGIDAMRGWFEKTADKAKLPGGIKFSDAWWAVMNGRKSPIAALRKMIGFRNPYQQMLNVKVKRPWEEAINSRNYNEVGATMQVFGDADQKTIDELRDMIDQAWMMGRGKATGDIKDVGELLDFVIKGGPMTPMKAGAAGIDSAKAVEYREIWGRWKELKERWFQEADEAVKEGIIPSFGEVKNYLPQAREGGLGFTKPKTSSFGENVDKQIARVKVLFGDELQAAADASVQAGKMQTVDELAREIVEVQGYRMVTDFRELVAHRALAQSQMMARVDLVRQARQLGINVDELPDMMKGKIPELGMKSVNVYGLDNYVFDNEMAGILENALGPITDRTAGNAVKNMFSAYTSWWKGMVTLTTGFHLRNWMSNQMTGFMKHGMNWFNVQKYGGASLAGTYYALHPEKYMDLIKKQFGKSDGWVVRNLNKKFGDRSIQELADYAVEKGVISRSTHGFSAPQAKKMMQKPSVAQSLMHPTDNVAMRFSRSVGDLSENTSRFQSFLMDFEKGNFAGDQALEYASLEAKKWFIDYGDLTDFEKNVMRNVIPFYSWLRKNMANQLSGILLYPSFYSAVPKFEGKITNDQGFDYDLQPDWQKQMGMFPVSRDPDTNNWIMFRPDFPFRDINLIPLSFGEEGDEPRWEWKEAIHDVMSAVHPAIKTIMELAPERGWNFFKRREIREEEPAPQAFQFLAKAMAENPGALAFLDGFMRLAGHSNGLKVDLTKDHSRVMMDGKTVQLLQNNMPALRTAAVLAEGGEELAKRLFPGKDIEGAVERVTGKRDYYEGLEETLQILSTWGGIKFKTLVEEEEQNRLRNEVLSAAEKARSDSRSNTLEGRMRSNKYWLDRQAKQRRLGIAN